MPFALRILIIYPLLAILGLAAVAIAIVAIIIALAYPNLPSLDVLTDYHPKIPMRIYTADGFLMGEFGEERRAVVAIDAVPTVMKQAIRAYNSATLFFLTPVQYALRRCIS